MRPSKIACTLSVASALVGVLYGLWLIRVPDYPMWLLAKWWGFSHIPLDLAPLPAVLGGAVFVCVMVAVPLALLWVASSGICDALRRKVKTNG